MALPNQPVVHNLTAEEVARGVDEGRMMIVDVREAHELAAESEKPF